MAFTHLCHGFSSSTASQHPQADGAPVRPQCEAQLGPEPRGDKPLHGGYAIPLLRDHVAMTASRYLQTIPTAVMAEGAGVGDAGGAAASTRVVPATGRPHDGGSGAELPLCTLALML